MQWEERYYPGDEEGQRRFREIAETLGEEINIVQAELIYDYLRLDNIEALSYDDSMERGAFIEELRAGCTTQKENKSPIQVLKCSESKRKILQALGLIASGRDRPMGDGDGFDDF